MSGPSIVSIVNAAIRYSPKAAPVVRNLTLTIEPGQAWVFTGPLGSGKTTVLNAIRGHLPVDDSASLTHPFLGRKVWPSEVIKILDSNVTVAGSSAYYSERYHARREDDYALRTWLTDSAKRSSGEVNEGATRAAVDKVAGMLGLEEFLDASTMNLSNGQTKRAAIAKALLGRPRVLLLDEPFVGLDVGARENLTKLLGNLATATATTTTTDSPKVVLALRPLDDIPTWATHLLWMNADGTPRYAGPADTILPTFQAELAEARLSRAQVSPVPISSKDGEGEEVVRLDRVEISYWGKPVLRDVSWTLRRGERWHLSGSNGSGKTTLLSLILGDHPKVYANDVSLFGVRRTTRDGRSLSGLQAEMGHTSPEIHRHYPRFLTGRQCLQSAYGDSFYPTVRLSVDRVDRLEGLADAFDLTSMLDVRLSEMSPAVQRQFLFLRAVVKRPRLLILDEPFAGMDARMIRQAKAHLDAPHSLPRDTTMIFVTHHEDEVPASVDKRLTLHRGEVVYKSGA